MTRWAAPGNSDSSARRTAAIRVPLITEHLPGLPSLKVIAEAQTQSPPSTGSGFTPSKESNLEIWKIAQGKIYVPEEDEELQLCICAAAYCGLGGHIGLTATTQLIKDRVFWTTMDADI